MKKTPGESQGNGFDRFVGFMRDTGNALCKGARQAPIISSYFDMLDDLAKLMAYLKRQVELLDMVLYISKINYLCF